MSSSFVTFRYKSNVNLNHLFLNFLFLSLFFSYADHGKIIKAVNAQSADSSINVTSVVIEELDVLPTNEPIRNLEIIRTTQYGKYTKMQTLHFERERNTTGRQHTKFLTAQTHF